MRPEELQVSTFASYPPQARALAEANLAALRHLPLNFLGILLSELIGFDWRFPVEQEEIRHQLGVLSSASPHELGVLMADFSALPLTPELYRLPWAREPVRFVEEMTAYLWTAKAIDAYRAAALRLGQSMTGTTKPDEADVRWCLVVVGRDAHGPYPNLFRQLRPKGTTFTKVDTDGCAEKLVAFVTERARKEPRPYAHWHVNGGAATPTSAGSGLWTVSYDALGPLREDLLRRMHQASTSGTVGPESLRSIMAQLRPADLPWGSIEDDAVARHFQLSLLTEGSGTQIFSTTFVQWAGRELLRRARPSTLLLRYAPRQVDRPMNDLLLGSNTPPMLDPQGSLEDASMGAYYTWINLQRLPGGEKARFLCIRESGSEAVAVAPGLPQASISSQPCTVDRLLKWMA